LTKGAESTKKVKLVNKLKSEKKENMDKKYKVSVVMPTFNEEKALPLVVADIRKYTSNWDTEILIVDSSSDSTPKIAKELGIKVISQPPKGHGIALRTCIKEASGDYVFTTDCDNTYPMDMLPEFIKSLTDEDYDLVSGNRLFYPDVRKAMPGSNLFANRAFAFITRLLYGVKTHDVTTGMFGFKRKVVQTIDWETNYSFPSEIIIRSSLAGFKYKEIPITYKLRVGEVTLNKWRSGKAYMRCFLKYRFNLSTPKEKL
jgi:glycosyltransferase involved in cell wall biosynthesis